MINDEIQTGLGRTGKLFCGDWDGEPRRHHDRRQGARRWGVPGFRHPGSSSEIMDVFHPGDHGSTFGGNPLGAAVGMAALDVIAGRGPGRPVERSSVRGSRRELESIDSPHIDHVRGRGLFVGVVIKDSSGPARPFCEELQARGHPGQGDARAGDPLRATARHREGHAQVGARQHRRGRSGRDGGSQLTKR